MFINTLFLTFREGHWKYFFASSQKVRIFALVNRWLGLPKRVLFAYSVNGELGHFTLLLIQNKEDECSLVLYS